MWSQHSAGLVHSSAAPGPAWHSSPVVRGSSLQSCKRCRRVRPTVAGVAGAELALTAASAAVDMLQTLSAQASDLANDMVMIPPEQAAQLTLDGITAAAQDSISSSVLNDFTIRGPCSPYGLMVCAWQAYCQALESKPLETKLVTGLVGTVLGDVTAQYYTSTQEQHGTHPVQAREADVEEAQHAAAFQYDAPRTLRLMAFSALLGTPMGHYEYEMLEKVVMPSDPTSPVAVALKVGYDQLIQTPIGMSLFFGSIKLMEGRPHDMLPTLRAKVWPSLLANWSFWPAAQLVNFTLVPLSMRILYVNLLCIAWTAYISLVANSPAPSAAVTNAAQQQQQQRAPLPAAVRSLDRLRVGSRVRAVLGGLRKA